MHRASCRLPKKPSALILLALGDLAKAERSAQYRIDMGSWHVGIDAEPASYDPETCKAEKSGEASCCAVCLAGSVMAFSLNVPDTLSIEPYAYPRDVRHALLAINDFRVGDVGEGLEGMGVPAAKIRRARDAFGASESTDEVLWNVPVPHYTARNSAKFKKAMRAMAKKLASVGL